MAPANGESPRGSRNAVPAQQCDIIMKGGVTSGVVYPSAILSLCERYRFRNIGGTSAGAIAAAATAAAEYGRQLTQPSEGAGGHGFAKMADIAQELASPGFLKTLFKPTPGHERLFATLLGLKRLHDEADETGHHQRNAAESTGSEASARASPRKAYILLWWLRGLGGLLRETVRGSYWWGCLVGLLLAGGLTSGLLWWSVQLLSRPELSYMLLGLVLFVSWLGICLGVSAVGGFIGGGKELWRLFMRLRDKELSKYGICAGSDGDKANVDKEESLGLTDWLHVRINQLAGRPPRAAPLTLAELAKKELTLKMVTCDLSLGQPYILPLRRGSRSFFFKRSEMARLFPPPVVDALEKWGEDNRPTKSIRIRDEDSKEFLRFPMGPDLPVVVATRMSLSFPVLLSAVRLYSVKPEVYEKHSDGTPRTVDLTHDLEEHWFSDGGIASNFPIHIFDSWLPLRPTFGITLYDSPIRHVLDQLKQAAPAAPSEVLPLPRDFEKARPKRLEIDGLGDFLRAVFETAQSFRDNAMAGLPSYRERIVQVFLEKHEGGLNLEMPSAIIDDIKRKGERAAALLLERYSDVKSPHFSEHRWVRFLVLMAELERQLFEIRPIFPGDDWVEQLRKRFDELFELQLAARNSGTPWYRQKDEAWCREAGRRLEALLGLIREWDEAQRAWNEGLASQGRDAPAERFFFAHDPPRPEGMLKVMPDL